MAIFVTVVVAFAVATLVYIPGLSGPFLFDDFANIVDNAYVTNPQLSWESLRLAATTSDSGPTHRPIAMISFALNYVLAGNRLDPWWFKLVNLVIHAVNGMLVFLVSTLIFRRASAIGASTWSPRAEFSVALILALWWTVHPIGLTSVLYVVQRMTSLSATFVLAGIAVYLFLRLRAGPELSRGQIAALAATILVATLLAVLTKESGALLPIFVLTIEAVLFSGYRPWSRWPTLPRNRRYVAIAAVSVIAVTVVVMAVRYSIPGYGYREFSMLERVLTEPRMLVLYISLVFAPMLGRFGLFHDDRAVSVSLLEPWTTTPAIFLIALLVATALVLRRRAPMVSLGLLWFFTGHLLESTVYPLELAHEHRNYLASFGLLLSLTGAGLGLRRWLRPALLYGSLGLMALTAAGVSFARASQWSDELRLMDAEAAHHPASPRAVSGYGAALAQHGRYAEAVEAFRRAHRLDPNEPGILVNIELLCSGTRCAPASIARNKLTALLATGRITTLTLVTLGEAGSCIDRDCRGLAVSLESWANTLLGRRNLTTRHRAFAGYLLGRALAAQGRNDEAIRALTAAHAIDRDYLHPLFEIVNIHIRAKDRSAATAAYRVLVDANRAGRFPRPMEIETIGATVANMGKSS